MKCPNCRQDNDRVIDSRSCDDGFGIRRRRECQHCQKRFTTYERVERPTIKVMKRDGTREIFDRNKLKCGLEIACRKRPVSDEQIEKILTAVQNEIENSIDTEIENQYLGELLMGQLFQLDQIAFVRFASVYHQFSDAQDFVTVLNMLTKKK